MSDTEPVGAPARETTEASGLHDKRYVGEVLGGSYRIARKIGAGGMADVYEVEHLRLGNRCAAKVLRRRSSEDASTRRFVQEARLLARLESEHVVRVLDVGGLDDGTPFYVMELLRGHDLRKLIASAPDLAVPRAVKIVSDACRGLSVAHAAGLVHRDLKPENLFVVHRDDGEEVCKILDFGVAKTSEGNSTEHGTLVGTVRYMAPEQIESAGNVSPRADVRGLGAILYECLTGRPPHVADTVERLLFKILNEKVQPLRAHRPELPPPLDDVVQKALERDPARRFSSAQELADALAPFIPSRVGVESTPTFATGTGARFPAGLLRRRGSLRLFVGVSGVFAAGAALGALAFGGNDSAARGTPAPVEMRTGTRKAAQQSQLVNEHERVPVSVVGGPLAVPRDVARAAQPPDAKPKPRRGPAGSRPAETARAPEITPPDAAFAAPLVKIDSRNPYGP